MYLKKSYLKNHWRTHFFVVSGLQTQGGEEKRDKTRSFINKMFSSGIEQNRCSTNNFVYLQL